MLKEKLKDYNIILASASPRRQELMKELGVDFKVSVKAVVEEYPERLKRQEISDYLAQLKSLPFENEMEENDLLITSDTIVWHNEQAIGKPRDFQDAFNMIKSMSGMTHEVYTSICFKTIHNQITVNDRTGVTFKTLSDDEISYYLKSCKPYDKAGAYGIQDWIGKVGVTKIEGSYFNVMGFPIHLVYKTLNTIASRL